MLSGCVRLGSAWWQRLDWWDWNTFTQSSHRLIRCVISCRRGGKKQSVHLVKGCEMRWTWTCFFCFFVWFFFYLQTNFLGGELNHEYVPLSISIKTDTIHFPPPEQIIHPKADFCLLLCVLYSGLIVTVTQNDMISGLMWRARLLQVCLIIFCLYLEHSLQKYIKYKWI